MLIKILFTLCLVAVLCAGCVVSVDKSESAGKSAKAKEPERLLRHVVLFKYSDSTTVQQIRETEEAFRALPGKIGAIHAFEWGTDVSVENKSEGYTHCFLVSFLSESDRDAYLNHAAHQEFSALLRPGVDKVLVLDYWARK